MIVNESGCKLEIVQKNAKFIFQFVIRMKIYLLWCQISASGENSALRKNDQIIIRFYSRLRILVLFILELLISKVIFGFIF